MLAYGYDALLKYQRVQNGEIAQGNQTTATSTATTY